MLKSGIQQGIFFLLAVLGTGFTARAQDYRFTAGIHVNNSWGRDHYARKIGD